MNFLKEFPCTIGMSKHTLVFLLTLNKSQNLVVILLALNKPKKLTAKLLWEKLDAYAFFFFFECIGIQFFNSLACDLQDAMSRQRALTLFTHTLFPTQPCHPSLSCGLLPGF